MKEFYYKAKKNPTSIIEGTIRAEDKNAALTKLSDEGLYPIELGEKQVSRNLLKDLFTPRKISTAKMAYYTRSIADLLEGGIPVLEAFNIVSGQISHPLLKKITEQIKKDLKDGQPLSWSMQNQMKYFSPLFINLVKAGEASGTLEASFTRIADFYEKRDLLKNSLIKSMAYPVFLFFVGFLTIAILFVFILPKLIPVFEDMGVTVPLITSMLLKIADIVQSHWPIIFVLIMVLMFIAKKLLSKKDSRFYYQKLLLAIPYVRTITLKKALSESFYSFGTLVQNGVPPVNALEITKDSTENVLLFRDFEDILANFKQGKSISSLMEGSKFFFPECVNMIRVGEKTGNLEKPLLKLSLHYERDVQRTLDIFVTVVEPAMILFFGITIGFVAIAILLPIFQMNFSVS